MPANPPPRQAPPAATLAGASLPRRVRSVLESVLRLASAELEQRLEEVLVEFEQQLFRLADHARNPAVQSGYLQTLRNMRLNRADLIPRFMIGMEANLAALGQEVSPADPDAPSTAGTHASRLALVEHADVDDALMLHEIAQRGEAAASLELHLLGQRFGVLAAAPAFDAGRIPLGPRALCGILKNTSGALQLPAESQLLLLRTFERKVMAEYGEFAERLNATLAAEGVLPALTYVPVRVRGTAPEEGAQLAEAMLKGGMHGGAGTSARPQPAVTEHGSARQTDAPAPDASLRPHTGWGLHDPAMHGHHDEPGFDALQQMLRGRDESGSPDTGSEAGASFDTTELIATLSRLRSSHGSTAAQPKARIGDIKREVLERVRSQLGPDAGLSLADSDTFDLLDLLYDRIERDVRVDTLAAELIKRLQVPVLQAALRDRGFFSRPQHPARELLNTVAETGARWLGAGEIDPTLERPLRQAVDHVVERVHEDPTAFETSNRNLQHELQQHARRAEMAERRHVESARGREKLEVAKRHAADTIATMIGAQVPQKFVRALIEQAWADVLTLTLLRHGAESDAWQDMLDTTKRIVAASCGTQPAPDPELAGQVQEALSQVGYHADEAAAIGKRLTSVPGGEDAASRTQIAATLKARARLGEQSVAAPEKKVKLPPRTPDEQAQYERVRVLPYGTWIEFVVNQQGDVVRKRLSWYSPLTDNALLVNLRGQRVGEQTLDSLARMIAKGQARVVTMEHARLVDRAWQATVSALRGLSGRAGAKPASQAPA